MFRHGSFFYAETTAFRTAKHNADAATSSNAQRTGELSQQTQYRLMCPKAEWKQKVWTQRWVIHSANSPAQLPSLQYRKPWLCGHWAIWASIAWAVHSGAVWLIFSSRLFTWKHRDWICLSQVGKASRAAKGNHRKQSIVLAIQRHCLNASFTFGTALTCLAAILYSILSSKVTMILTVCYKPNSWLAKKQAEKFLISYKETDSINSHFDMDKRTQNRGTCEDWYLHW